MNMEEMAKYPQTQEKLMKELGEEFSKRQKSADKLEADKVEYLRIIAANTSEILKTLQSMDERLRNIENDTRYLCL